MGRALTAVLALAFIARPRRGGRCPGPDQGRHHRLRPAERRAELGSPELGAAREHHPRLPRLRPPRRARPQDGEGGAEPRASWKALDDTTWEVKLRRSVKFHDGTPFAAKDVKATFDRVLNPENKLTARGNHAKIKSVEVRRRLHRPLQDRRPLPALRRAPHRPGDAVREGDQGEGPRVDAGQPRGHRALQAREVEQEAGAPPRRATTTTGAPSPPSSTSASGSSPSRPRRSPS